jgi:hypothetical protein
MREPNENLDVSDALWNDHESDQLDNKTYNSLLIEQYKIYVEMADRVSARRSVAHTFFLTFHAIIISVLGLTLNNNHNINNLGMLAFPLLGLLVLCYAWWRLVQYFRRVSRAKSNVIAELETRLPTRSFWSAERKAMSRDNPYNPLKRMEVTLPFVFAFIYILIYIYVALWM